MVKDINTTGAIAGILGSSTRVGVIRGTVVTKTTGMPITAIPIPTRSMCTHITATADTELAEAVDTTA
jgi:hypothetical protein